MDLVGVLLSFEQNPLRCEQILKEEEQKSASTLALKLCELSRPLTSGSAGPLLGSSSGVPQAHQLVLLRLLSLVALQGVLERSWNAPSSALKRQQQQQQHRLISETEKRVIQDMLLADVISETVANCAAKRAQLVAWIAKYEWLKWGPTLFPTLLPPAFAVESTTSSANSKNQLLRLFFTLHCVLKALAGQRIGSQIESFRKNIAVELYPRLRQHLSVILHHTTNFESMPDYEAEMATWICKCINSLIRGSNSIQELAISSHFEIVIATMTFKPSSPWSNRLVRTLRKTCLTAMKCHPGLFNDYFFAAFAEKTIQIMQLPVGADVPSSDSTHDTLVRSGGGQAGSGRDASNSSFNHPQLGATNSEQQEQLLIFCYAFWTEALLQKQYQTHTNHVIDRGLPLVTKTALTHLRLSQKDLERWRREGGEQFCYEDGDIDALLVKPGKEDTLRRGAKKFLQTCFDQPLPSRADACLNEIFSNHYGDPLAIEAAFLAVQLCSFRLHSKWHFDEFLKTRLLPCVTAAKPTPAAARTAGAVSALEQACLARRACCVIQAWVADISLESLPVVYSALFAIIQRSGSSDQSDPTGDEEDLGVCLSAMECLMTLMSEARANTNTASGLGGQGGAPSSPNSSASQILVPSTALLSSQISLQLLCRLYDRMNLGESKQKLLSYVEQILLCHSTSLRAAEGLTGMISYHDNGGGGVTVGLKSELKDNLTLVLCRFVPFVVKRSQTARAQDLSDESPGLVLESCMDLARICIKLVGFAELDLSAKQVCVDVIRFCLRNPIAARAQRRPKQSSSAVMAVAMTVVPQMEEDVWSSLLLVCLKTATAMFLPLLEFLQYEACLRTMHDVKLKCQLVDCACLLWTFTKMSGQVQSGEADLPAATRIAHEFSLFARDLVEYFVNANARQLATRDEQQPPPLANRGVIAQTTSPDADPFTLLYVCRCLDVLLKTRVLSREDASLKAVCWDRVLNYSMVDETQDDSFHIDSRDVIERLTVSARIILCEYSFFPTVQSAEAFARLCNKYLDAVGYAPSEAPWRRRLWTSAMLLTVSRCDGLNESTRLVPYVVQACAFICREMQQLVGGADGTPGGAFLNGEDSRHSLIEPPCFTSVDDENLAYDVDFDRQRREQLFRTDEFLKVNFRLAFQKVWKIVLQRFGGEGLQRITAALSKTTQMDLNALLSSTGAFTSNSAPPSPRSE